MGILLLAAALLFASPDPQRFAPDGCAWTALEEHDTLILLFRNREIGTLIYTIDVSDSGEVITERTLMRVAPTTQVSGIDHMELEEARRYDFFGELVDASQSLQGQAGRSAWRLSRAAHGGWTLRVVAGGVENLRSVARVADNLRALWAVKCGIQRATIKTGDAWADTTFDLISGQNISALTVCRETPAVANGYRWIFTKTNELTGREERWELDSSGRTLYREMPPFFSAASPRCQRVSFGDSLPVVDMMEIASIPMDRAAAAHERVGLALDSGATMHSSALGWYTKKHNRWWVLRQPPQKCRPAQRTWRAESLSLYTAATPIMQTGDARIAALARKLRRRNPCETIRAMNAHVFAHLRKRNTATFSSAVETLDVGFGDCGEHAVLLAALLRSAGIPARVVYGLLYLPNRKGYYYHAWVMAHAREWIFADPSHGVFPAWRDRIPLIIDDTGENIMHLGALIERIHIEYLAAPGLVQ